MAQDDEDEDDHEPEGYYPDDGGTASNIDAARTHVSETRLEQGSQQQDAGALPADQMDAKGDGPGEASSPQLSDEQVCMFPRVLIEQHGATSSQSNARTPSISIQPQSTRRRDGMAHRRHTASACDTICPTQRRVEQLVMEGKNVFFTGNAGTGKLLQP